MTGDGTIDRDDDLLVAEYVLGVLPHAERAALTRRLETDRALAGRARFWSEHFAPLAASIEPVSPPASVLAAVERRLFPIAARHGSFWESLAFWRGLSAALFSALIVAGLAFSIPRFAAPTGATGYVAQLTGTADAVSFAAYYDAASRTLRLNRVAGAPPSNRAFELWLIVGGNAPVSLGVLPPEPLAAVPVAPAIAAKLKTAAVLAVSDEPAGGSPTGQPTGAVLATGLLNAI